MSFPSLDAFAADRSVGRLTFRVYMYLQACALDFTESRPVKVTQLAFTLHIRKAGVTKSLNWLVANGFLEEQARGPRGVRSFILNYRPKTTTERRMA